MGMVLQALVIAFFPAFALWIAMRVKALEFLGPVVLCYIAGIVIGNIPLFTLSPDLSSGVTQATVLLAIPLLLFSTDFIRWLKMAPATVFSFALCLLSAALVAGAGSFLFADKLPEASKIAGMLVGVYTGGTPNMTAIGLALDVNRETYLMVHSSDVFLGGVYFLFLLSFLPKVLARVLPAFDYSLVENGHDDSGETDDPINWKVEWKGVVPAMVLSFGIAGAGAGVSVLLTGQLKVTPIILTTTTLAIACSFVPRIRSIRVAYDAGQYLLLAFCVAIGSMADISKMVDTGGTVFAYTALVIYGSGILHYLLAMIFRIDRDTVIITSTAAIFGPPFVGPVANVLKNRHVVVSGITTGLVGLALGNYLGIGLAYLLGR